MNRGSGIARSSRYAIVLLLLGVTLGQSANPPGDADPAVRVPSDVAWTRETIKVASGGDPFRGMLLARRCGHCHGTEGFSAESGVPNLAGIDRLSIWKQLQDFRSGKRISSAMQPITTLLSVQDLADVSAYFSMLPTFADPQDNRAFPQAGPDPAKLRIAQKLVSFGDGQRGVPPCQACHGPVGYIKGAPALSTQNTHYLLNQLQHFAEGTRTNDINVVMRSVAKQLTPEEQAALAEYYGTGRGVNAPGDRPSAQ